MMLIRPSTMKDAEWLNQVSRQIEALQSMMKTEGWQLLDNYLEGEQRAMDEAMTTVDTSDKAMKLIGAMKTLKNMRRFPIATIEACTRELQRHTK